MASGVPLNDVISSHFTVPSPGAVNDKLRAFFDQWYFGEGSPEGVVTAPTGSLYLQKNGTTQVVWQKQSGSGNTGWGALASGTSGAPSDAQYVTLAADGTLSAEAVLGSSVVMSGTLAARPAAGVPGRLYFATDDGDAGRLHRDTGAAWATVGMPEPGIGVPTGAAMWALPGAGFAGSSSTLALSASTAYYMPIFATTDITISDIAASVTSAATAGGKARLSLYRASSAWVPGALVAAFGEFEVDSTGDKVFTGLSQVFKAGRGLLRLHTDASATPPTVRRWDGSIPGATGFRNLSTNSAAGEWTKALAYAPAETPGTAWDTISTSVTTQFRYFALMKWTA